MLQHAHSHIHSLTPRETHAEHERPRHAHTHTRRGFSMWLPMKRFSSDISLPFISLEGSRGLTEFSSFFWIFFNDRNDMDVRQETVVFVDALHCFEFSFFEHEHNKLAMMKAAITETQNDKQTKFVIHAHKHKHECLLFTISYGWWCDCDTYLFLNFFLSIFWLYFELILMQSNSQMWWIKRKPLQFGQWNKNKKLKFKWKQKMIYFLYIYTRIEYGWAELRAESSVCHLLLRFWLNNLITLYFIYLLFSGLFLSHFNCHCCCWLSWALVVVLMLINIYAFQFVCGFSNASGCFDAANRYTIWKTT